MMHKDSRGEIGRVRLSILVGAVLVVPAAAALMLWWYVGVNEQPAGEAMQIDADDTGLVALGRTVYAAHCAACHGAGLQGEPDWRRRREDGSMPAPPHDDTGHTWHHPDGMLFGITKLGGQSMAPPGYVSGMPGFDGTLSDREIAASLAFIKSRWSPEIRQRQTSITRQSR
jgi:mono/diheme cytochrome c family protein